MKTHIAEYLEARGAAWRAEHHPHRVTAQEVAAVEHVSGKRFAKTIVLEVEDAFALAVLPACRPTVVIADLAAGGASLVEALRAGDSGDVPVLVLGDPRHAAEFEALLDLGPVRYLARGTEWEHFRRTFDTMRSRAEPELSL